VEETCIPVVMPLLMAKNTQNRYQDVIRNYLLPVFGNLCLRDLTTLAIQRYFSSMAASKLAQLIQGQGSGRACECSQLGGAVRVTRQESDRSCKTVAREPESQKRVVERLSTLSLVS